jgi:5-methylcytosine-specific restriction protein B
MTVAALPTEVTNARAAEFQALFLEFAGTYLKSEEGRTHLAMYGKTRLAAQTSYKELRAQADAGVLDTDMVLLKLLPWNDSDANRKRGAWTHVAPAITGDLKGWFENVGWTTSTDWPEIARVILSFIGTCVDDPSKLEVACSTFASNPLTKGFQSGFLSPALSALRPDAFIIGNSKSRTTINHFADVELSARLTDYPALNATGLGLISSFAPLIGQATESSEPRSDLFDAFSHWLVAVKMYDFGAVGYWKVAPGSEGHLWQQWLEGGYASIDWEDLGNLADLTYTDFEARRADAIAGNPEWTKEALEQVWNFAHIREGDRLVANQGTTKVLGVGRVTGPYYFVPGTEHGHRLPVDWEDTNQRTVKKGGWRKTLVKLNRSDFTEVASGQAAAGAAEHLSERAFALLTGLHQDPSASYYQSHKADFEKYVEGPIQNLLMRIAARVPVAMSDRLETEKRIFAKFVKNDYGRGGAWEYYWGAFYSKGAKRIAAPQLYVWIDRNVFGFGFSIGDQGVSYKARFAQRAKENADVIVQAMGTAIEDSGVKFGSLSHDVLEAGRDTATSKSFANWLADPAAGDFTAAVSVNRDTVLATAAAHLEDRVLKTFQVLFPLMRLAAEDVPIGEIFEIDEEDAADVQLQRAYPLDQFSIDAGIDRDTLEMWIRAINRKGQAILYGPPGTGKTWTAQRLAKHLVAGGDGLVDLVQFHPAYSYEDFIQGIRPQTENGAVTYALESGRFLDFCRRAAGRTGPSVLIVDEINRANLARVLGELMYLLEYRTQSNEMPLAGGGRFYIPDQVRIIGTMNTADRSIALVDHALRRRFAFLRLRPNLEVLRTFHAGSSFPIGALIHVIETLNKTIANPDYEVGISFFLVQDLELNVPDIWSMEIEPYLDEYFFNDSGKVAPFRWSAVKSTIGL